MKNGLTRRQLLRRGGLAVGAGMAALGGLGPLQHLASAQVAPGAPDRYYIFVYFSGGWDVLLGLDPRDPREFPSEEESIARTRIQPAYEQVALPDADIIRVDENRAFGPYIGDLVRHTDKFTVVRGINMETLGHASGRRRFLTGKPSSGVQARGSNGTTWLAGHLGQGELIPQLSLRTESYNKDMPNFATALRVNSVPDLLRALRPSSSLFDPRLQREMDLALGRTSSCPDAIKSTAWQNAEFSRKQARDVVESDVGGYFDFAARTPAMEALRGHYGFTRVDNSAGVGAALAAQAITNRVSRAVSVTLVGGLDTHDGNSWRTNQGLRQRSGFNAIARLIEDLESREYGDGSSWFDHTTIVAFSEFSRTPALNAIGGRDHHFTNSCLIAGGGVQGGQIIGASSNVAMESMATNLQTGRPDPGGVVLKPEHILRTLFDEVGIDGRPDLRVRGMPALMRS